MAGKSVGQWVGTIAGAVIGAFMPGSYIALGAAVGGMVGGLIDPPKGPTITGPRLNDLSVTGVGFDQPLPRLYGTIATFGTLIWVEGNQIRETKNVEEQGGKGGGGTEVESFSYSYTFALAFGMGPIHGIRRISCSGKLLYDAGSDDIATIIASNAAQQSFRLYTGTDDQLPDARIQADLGVANTPAWRGIAYLVWDDFQLADYGNSPIGAQLKVEVVAVGETEGIVRKFETTSTEWRFAEEEAVVPGDRMFEGIPYIIGISDGVLTVRQRPSFWTDASREYLLSSTDGHLIRRLYGMPPYISGDVTGETPGEPCGVLPWGDHLYVDFTLTIENGGFFTYPTGLTTAQFMVPEDIVYLTVAGYEDHKIIGCSLSNDAQSIFLMLSAPAQSINTPATRTWMVVDTQMTILASGATANNFVVGEIGFSRCCLPAGRSASFDSLRGELCVVFGAGSGEIDIYRITGGLLIKVDGALSPDGLTYFYFTSASVLYESGVAYVISGADYNVFTFGKILPEQVTLRSIVEAECLNSGLLESSDIDATALTSLVRGYRVTSAGALRSALEPLQAAWPFDVVPRGYQIVFVPRGQSSVATIEADDLGAVAGGERPGVRITVAREMDVQIPRRVEVSYLEIDREYDIGNQSAERLNTDAVNVFKTELPIVFNASEAIQRAEVLLYIYWLERNDLTFVLPPTFVDLEAADVVTINAPGATYEARLTSINLLPDGRLECSAKLNNAATYTSSAVADGGYSPPQTLTLNGSAETVFMDLPCIDTRTDACGFLAAVGGYFDTWGGGGLFYSSDSGESWKQVEWITPPGATMGFVTAAVGAGRTDIFDGQNAITVRLLRGSLASVSESALMAGSNHFAYGKPGRWEIVAAQNATENADNTYTLTRLIRGRFGTEDMMTEHETNDYLVLLDANSVYWVDMELSSINAARKYRMVNRGRTLESATDIDFTLVNESRVCRKPTGIMGGLLRGSYDWTYTVFPRSRLPVPLFSGVAQPSGESTTLYRLKIYDGSGFSTIKRTLESSGTNFTYPNAQMMADFGALQETTYVGAVQVSPAMGEGYELRTVIVSTGIYNPMFSLIHFSGSGATLVDACGLTWANSSMYNNQVTWPVKFGTHAFNGDTNRHYATVGSGTIGAGDFTFDFWLYPTGVNNAHDGVFHLSNGALGGTDNLTGIGLCLRQSGFRYVVVANGIATDVGPINNFSMWSHHAIERKNGVIRFYTNGVASATTIADTTDYSNCTNLTLGAARTAGGTMHNAYLDEFRAMSASAYDGTNFTPPTAEYPNP